MFQFNLFQTNVQNSNSSGTMYCNLSLLQQIKAETYGAFVTMKSCKRYFL